MVLSLQGEGVGFAYRGGPPVLEDVGFDLAAGDILCLLGPNGGGKTTLLRCVLGLERITAGSILVRGRPLTRLTPAEVAREMAYVPQSTAAVFPFAAFDVVLMGRSAHLRFMADPTVADRRLAREALAHLDIDHLAARRFHELSGGEQQMVLIARALAQGSKILVMDEPCAGLDVGNQVRILRTIRALAHQGYSILLSSHQPDHAFLLGGQVALLKGGRLRGPGTLREIVTAAALSELYGTTIHLIPVSSGSMAAHLCVPLVSDD